MNPATPFAKVEPFLGEIDLLLVMTVVPGFGGQAFIPETMESVRAAAEHRRKHDLEFHIEVDGGISGETAGVATSNGANVLVSGTSLFKAPDMGEAIREFRAS